MCCTLAKALFNPCYTLNLYQALSDAGKPELLYQIKKLKMDLLKAHIITLAGVIMRACLYTPGVAYSASLVAGVSFVSTASIVIGTAFSLYFCKKLYDILKIATSELANNKENSLNLNKKLYDVLKAATSEL